MSFMIPFLFLVVAKEYKKKERERKKRIIMIVAKKEKKIVLVVVVVVVVAVVLVGFSILSLFERPAQLGRKKMPSFIEGLSRSLLAWLCTATAMRSAVG